MTKFHTLPEGITVPDAYFEIDASALLPPTWHPAEIAVVRLANGTYLKVIIEGEDYGFIAWSLYRERDGSVAKVGVGLAPSVEAAKTDAEKAIAAFREIVEKA